MSICTSPIQLISLLPSAFLGIYRAFFFWAFVFSSVLLPWLHLLTPIGPEICMIAAPPLFFLVITISLRFQINNTQSLGLPLKPSTVPLPQALLSLHGYTKFCLTLVFTCLLLLLCGVITLVPLHLPLILFFIAEPNILRLTTTSFVNVLYVATFIFTLYPRTSWSVYKAPYHTAFSSAHFQAYALCSRPLAWGGIIELWLVNLYSW